MRSWASARRYGPALDFTGRSITDLVVTDEQTRTKSSACRRPTARRRSAPPIASSPRATIRTSTPASRRRRSGSRRSAPPTTCCPTRTSAPATTAARSTPPATRCRRSGRSTATSAMPPGARNTARMPAFDYGGPGEHLRPGVRRQAGGGRRTAVLDARPGRPLPAHARLPRCGQRHHPPRHAAGRADAGCAHSRPACTTAR